MTQGLKKRAEGPELMDLRERLSGQRPDPELLEAHRDLRRLNRLMNAAGPVLYGVNKFWEALGRPKRLSVLDVGCGAGGINRALLKWAARRGVDLRVILADAAEEAQIEARRIFAGEPRVTFVRRSLFDLPKGCADLVTASQFAHHFSPSELPGAVRRMLDVARRGGIIADIHRHRVAWVSVRAVTRLFFRNRYIRHDGPLSVARGFRREDWDELAAALKNQPMTVRWVPLFRWVVMLPKTAEPKGEENHDFDG